MKRPTITHEMILAAATIVAPRIRGNANTIAEVYKEYPMNGYQIARILDDQYGYEITPIDVEKLDAMDGLVRDELVRAEREWVQREGILPKLPLGTVLKIGVIEGVYDLLPARYVVKSPHCKTPGTFLLVPFEDAESEIDQGAATTSPL